MLQIRIELDLIDARRDGGRCKRRLEVRLKVV